MKEIILATIISTLILPTEIYAQNQGSPAPKSKQTASKENQMFAEKLKEDISMIRAIDFYDSKEYEKAFEELHPLARKGNPTAQTYIGLMFFDGNGVSQDRKEAYDWLRKAAEQGNRVSQFYLGLMRYFGDGVPTNLNEAKHWFQNLAEQGDANGQYYLGVMLYRGEGGPEDIYMARKWFQKSAAQGNKEATDSLKYMDSKLQ